MHEEVIKSIFLKGGIIDMMIVIFPGNVLIDSAYKGIPNCAASDENVIVFFLQHLFEGLFKWSLRNNSVRYNFPH